MQGEDKKTLKNVRGVLVVVGGGDVDLSILKELYRQGSAVVCADGGAKVCAQLDIVPALIVGDLDSLEGRAEWEKKCPVLQIVEQETTDFEKCLYTVEADTTVCLGFSGKRLDHTLAALDVMLRYSLDRTIVMVTETDLLVPCQGLFAFRVDPGARVSIHTIWPVDFDSSEGLEYSLNGVSLMPGRKLGTSNRAIEGGFEIVAVEHKMMPYLVIMERKYFYDWLEGLAF